MFPTLRKALEAHVFLPLSGLFVLLLIWLGTFHLIGVEQRGAERAVAESSREIIETYEAQLVRNLRFIDLTLKLIRYGYETKGAQQALAELNGKDLLPSPLLFTISIADHDGNVVASNRPHEARGIAGQQSFQVHRERELGAAFVSRVVEDPATGEGRLEFSQRLDKPDGSFGGVAVVAVEPGYFTSSFERSRLGDRGVIGLLGNDGVFRALRTGEQVSWGQQVDYGAATGGTHVKEGSGLLLTSPWDGALRHTNARRLPLFPLTAIVGLDEEEQLEGFRQHRRAYLLQAGIASAVLVCVVALLSRLTWQLAKTRERARKVQQTYYAASEASLDASFILRAMLDDQGAVTDFVVDEVNGPAARLAGMDRDELVGKTLCGLVPACRDNGVFDEMETVYRTGRLHEHEWESGIPSVQATWLYRQVVRVQDGVVAIVRDISARKRAEAELAKAQADLVTAARHAGMAEIATNVLHNVGNVLNSVNVSANLVGAKVRDSNVAGLQQAVELMDRHANDMARFMGEDAKGRMLPAYLKKLSEVLQEEQRSVIDELGHLMKSVDHIKDIVAIQQNYAGASSVTAPAQVHELVEDALRMQAQALVRHGVAVVKAFGDVPVLPLDKARLLQILVNLISNAKDARARHLTLRTAFVDGRVLRIGVEDDGEGIPAENLTRIFAHGFSTRKDREGHGFGLHSCAIAAQEMGGTLKARSDGPGRGAAFTLELPVGAS